MLDGNLRDNAIDRERPQVMVAGYRDVYVGVRMSVKQAVGRGVSE